MLYGDRWYDDCDIWYLMNNIVYDMIGDTWWWYRMKDNDG